jgi:hypothetical protein
MLYNIEGERGKEFYKEFLWIGKKYKNIKSKRELCEKASPLPPL